MGDWGGGGPVSASLFGVRGDSGVSCCFLGVFGVLAFGGGDSGVSCCFRGVLGVLAFGGGDSGVSCCFRGVFGVFVLGGGDSGVSCCFRGVFGVFVLGAGERGVSCFRVVFGVRDFLNTTAGSGEKARFSDGDSGTLAGVRGIVGGDRGVFRRVIGVLVFDIPRFSVGDIGTANT